MRDAPKVRYEINGMAGVARHKQQALTRHSPSHDGHYQHQSQPLSEDLRYSLLDDLTERDDQRAA